MSGYCENLAIAISVTATAEDPEYKNTWVCQVAINKNVACDKSYNNTTNMTAREVNGNWMCYD
jgi:hypothetical protein